jgi:hypothetical protein
MSTGNEPSLSPGVVEAVREAVRLVSPAPHGAIASFTYDPRNGLTIAGTAGWQAIVGNGSPQTTVTRIATLAAYLQKTADRSELPKVVDLRFPVSYATN